MDNNTIGSLNGYSDKDINDMNNYNTYLNSLELTVPTGEYKDYKVLFDLKFIDGKSLSNSEILASQEQIEGNNIGNTIQLGNAKTHPNLQFNFRITSYLNYIKYTFYRFK